MPPPVTARGSGGVLIAPPVGSGAKPQPLFCFCVYLAVISNTFPSRDIRITRACMDIATRKLFILHNAMVPTGSAIKFVTQSFCEFVTVTEACTWPCTSYRSVYKRLMYVLL